MVGLNGSLRGCPQKRGILPVDNQKENFLKHISLIVRIILGVVFIWASFDKILHPKEFAEVIYNYKIFSPQMVNLSAIVLPWIEFACGILLISGFLCRGSAFVIACLLIIFMAVLGHALYKGLDIRCGCFTLNPDADRIAVTDLMINGVLLISGLWVLFGEQLLSLRHHDKL
jgi:uncharacterized membrane protein YphA (DoxX/SURF4 family)